jgi:hypothetical protein|nr:MAG TPA: YopX protein [Caudoviricetes sp.]
MITKYRAWLKNDKKMIEVSFIDYDTKLIGLNIDLEIIIFDFDDVILMQSTGLKDKNGQEIFEGDIFGTKKDGLLNGIIEYREDLGMWTNNLIRYNNFERLCNVASSREIIGNVHQNPKLLEANHD